VINERTSRRASECSTEERPSSHEPQREQDQAKANEHPAEIAQLRPAGSPEHDNAGEDQDWDDGRDVESQKLDDKCGADIGA
jgi:hypothetical protein